MARTSSLLLLAVVLSCQSGPAAPIVEIAGTWGGENAGLIAEDTVAHVHIACTLGNARGPIRLDSYGRFEATGTYNVDAYPVDRGIVHPARFSGELDGQVLTLSVTLTDTGQQLGPVKLTKGKEPKMGQCPICRSTEEINGR